MYRLSLLGRAELRDGDGVDVRPVLAQPKRFAVLAYLAAQGEDACRRDKLLAVFWPESDAEHARKALNKTVHFLRQSLGEAVIVTRGAEDLAVNHETLQCDLPAFDVAMRANRYSEALELYRGDLLPAFHVDDAPAFDEWVEQERSRLRRLAARAARQLAEERESQRQFTTAISYARRAVELADDDERSVQHLLALLDRLGDRAGALYVYEKFARRLATEYDVEPAAETRQLAAQIRARDEAHVAVVATPADDPRTFVPYTAASAPTALRARGYEVEREIGRGGMATVYLAHDVRHDRSVAVKVLAPELGALHMAERFGAEIRVTARLQHPNILPLFDSGAADGLLFYVMPYVEGESLRGRLEREQRLPVDEAIALIRTLAGALQYAHEHGVVHRDIKPENILIQAGQPLLADFGISLALSNAGVDRLTATGLSLGTPQYMSPEQAAGELTVGPASDTYSLAAVAYELLTGVPPFTGPTPRAVLARVLLELPDAIRPLRSEVPPTVEAAILRALAKEPADRFATAGEFAAALLTSDAGAGPRQLRVRGISGLRRPATMLWRRHWRLGLAGGALLAAAIALFVVRKNPEAATLRLGSPRSVTREEGLEVDPAISPDGRTIAYAAQGPSDAAMRIYVRAVDGGNAVRVSGDLPGAHRFVHWSPDGTHLLFSVFGRGLYTIPKFGGAPRLVTDTNSEFLFGAWSPDGQSVVYSWRGSDALFVQQLSGKKRVLDGLGPGVHSPAWSPDGRWIAYVTNNPDYPIGPFRNRGPSAIHLVPAKGGAPIRLTDQDHMHMSPVWLPDSRGVLFVSDQEGGLDVYYVPIDAHGRKAAPFQRLTTDLHAGMIDLSPDGKQLAYSVLTHDESNIWSVAISPQRPTPLSEARPVTTGTQHIEAMSISKDRQFIAFDSDRGGNFDIYKMSLAGGEPLQLTRDTTDDFHPEWSPDGRWIAFQSWRSGSRDVYVVSTDGSGVEEVVAASAGNEYRASWAPDGRRLVLAEKGNISIVERLEAGKWSAPRRLTLGDVPEWSPDGRLIAYSTYPTYPGLHGPGLHVITPDGTNDRVVLPRPFRYQGRDYVPGGFRWSPDGKTLYVRAPKVPQSAVMVWAVAASGGAPRPLVFADDARWPARADIATDGTRLYFTIDNRQADIRIVPLSRR